MKYNKKKKATSSHEARKNKNGVNIIRIKGLNSRSKTNSHIESIPPTSNFRKHFREGICFAATEIPDIPPLDKTTQEIIDKLKTNNNQKAPSSHRKKISGKLNPFMAFRAYHSKDVTKLSDQREISGMLAKCWMKDLSTQLIWKRYSTEFNEDSKFYSENESKPSFVEWLKIKKTVLSSVPEQASSAASFKHKPFDSLSTKDKRDGRVENIFLEDLESLSEEQRIIGSESTNYGKAPLTMSPNNTEHDSFPFQDLLLDQSFQVKKVEHSQ